jgi:RNA polymerase sigma factor (sigma-70 family)
MPAGADRLIRYVRRIASPAASDPDTDAALLSRFLNDRDAAAFEALVARHGPMVFRVCHRLLADAQDAEDDFQATFLVLARKAASVRPAGALAAWLHGVASRMALSVRTVRARRRLREAPASDLAPTDPRPDPLAELTAREALRILDEEVQRLPMAYRLPVVLCCLEGRSQEEAARQLGWTPGSVKGRLERGRKHLHRRLIDRGLELAAALSLLEVARATAAGSSAALLASIARAGPAFAAGCGDIPCEVTMLAEGGLRQMTLNRVKVGLIVLLAAGVSAAGAGTLAHQVLAGRQPRAGQEPEAQAKDPPEARPQPREERSVRTDRYGDPLPSGAIARLGTLRFRNGMFQPCFFPDGKTIMTANRHTLQFWETATGRLLREIPTGALYVWRTSLSADGKQAAATGVLHNSPSFQAALRVWDVSTGKEVRTFSEKGRKTNQTSLTFTPDGKQLISIADGVACFEDIASGKELLRRQFSSDVLPTFALAPNGETVAIAPGANTWKFYLWNWKTEEPREIKVPRRPLYCLCFSPDSKTLAGCGQMESWLDLWDVGGGEIVRTIDMSKEAVSASDLAFSPDGKLLAVADSGNGKNFSGGLYLWDLERGRYFRQLPTPGEQVLFTNFSRDGRWIAATTTGGVRVWEVRTGRAVADNEATHCGSLTRIAVSSKGLVTTASFDHTVRIWDAATGRQRLKLDHDQPVENVILTPDGTNVVTATGTTLRFWDLLNGKELKRLPGQKRYATGRAMGFTPDGRRLLSWADYRSLRTWDVQTGKVLREHTIPPGAAGRSSIEMDRERERLMMQLGPCCFSPNGEYLILSLLGEFRVFETATGKEWQSIPSKGWRVSSLALSSDGRSFLASMEGSGTQSKHHTVSLWELATGKLRRSWSLPGDSAEPVALSHDGRFLAVGLSASPVEIRLFNVGDTRAVLTLSGFAGKPTLLSFSPDDRLLVSGMDDTSALVWQIPSSMGRPGRGLEPEAVRRLWEDLASADAARAYQAVLGLAQSPAEAVSFLGKHLQPVAAPEPKRIDQLIKDLDDDRYSVRHKAARELEKLGELAEPNLKMALAAKSSLEFRRRVEELLGKLQGPVVTPEALRGIRAVETLECIGTPEARAMLKKWSEGDPHARLTQDARASLERLAKRSGAAAKPANP